MFLLLTIIFAIIALGSFCAYGHFSSEVKDFASHRQAEKEKSRILAKFFLSVSLLSLVAALIMLFLTGYFFFVG